jgi:hypothetical protein
MQQRKEMRGVLSRARKRSSTMREPEIPAVVIAGDLYRTIRQRLGSRESRQLFDDADQRALPFSLSRKKRMRFVLC